MTHKNHNSPEKKSSTEETTLIYETPAIDYERPALVRNYISVLAAAYTVEATDATVEDRG